MRRSDARPGSRHEARAVSAQELAEMGFCERRVLLAHWYGPKSTPRQRADRKRGRQAHLRYFHEGLRSASSDRRSFVAPRVFSADALQIAILRAYRDWVLQLRRWGRLLVTAYIQAALSVCAALCHWLDLTVRRLRDAFAAGYRWFRDRSGR